MTLFLHAALYLLYLAIFVVLILKWKFFSKSGINKKLLVCFFFLKVIAGLTLTLLYTFYYTDQSKADIYRYFNDSKIISPLLFQHPSVWLHSITGIGINEPEVFRHLLHTLYFSHPQIDIATNNTFIIRFISVLNYFSFSNIYINTLILNFLSFISLTVLYKGLKKYFEEFPQVLLIPIYLLPSVVFWGSGMLKEQLLFIFIGTFFSIALSRSERKYVRWLLLAILLYIIWSIKPFIAVSLLVSLPLLPEVYKSISRKTWIMIIVSVLLGVLLLIRTGSGTSICEQLINKRNEFVNLALSEKTDLYFDEVAEPDCLHLLAQAPKALLHSVLRPFVWEKGTLFQYLCAIENSLFILFIAFLLIRFFKKPLKEELFLSSALLLVAFLNYLVIGFTVPITGAMVHYRVIAIPFFLIGIFLLTDRNKMKASFSSMLAKTNLFRLE
jgi:hypothetical protein